MFLQVKKLFIVKTFDGENMETPKEQLQEALDEFLNEAQRKRVNRVFREWLTQKRQESYINKNRNKHCLSGETKCYCDECQGRRNEIDELLGELTKNERKKTRISHRV